LQSKPISFLQALLEEGGMMSAFFIGKNRIIPGIFLYFHDNV